MAGIFLSARRISRRGIRPGVIMGLVFILAAAFSSMGTGAAQTLASTSTGGSGSASQSGATSPEAFCPSGGQCFADVPASNPFYDFVNRIYQQDLVSGYACGGAGEPCDAEGRPYYRPGASVTRQQMAKFIDNARRLPEINITANSLTSPVNIVNHGGGSIYAYSDTTDAIYAQSAGAGFAGVYGSGSIGVLGYGSTGAGVKGYNNSTGGAAIDGEATNAGGIGVIGRSGTGTTASGVYGQSVEGNGVLGYTETAGHSGVQAFGTNGANGVSGVATAAGGYGIYGYNAAGGNAGYFQGSVQVTGSLAKGAGSFKIDHPLDPENKYLYHSFVESPDMMNVYNGNVMLDAKGEASVVMPDWFDALNKEFRYQLTPLGSPGPNLYIAQEITGNRFKIAGGTPSSKVSWQVTGIRHDPYANEHRIPVEEDKRGDEKGKYLHPTEWGQPETKGIGYISQPDLEQMVPDISNVNK